MVAPAPGARCARPGTARSLRHRRVLRRRGPALGCRGAPESRGDRRARGGGGGVPALAARSATPDRRGRRHHIHHPHRHEVRVAPAPLQAPSYPRDRRRHRGAKRPSLLGPGRLQEAREAAAVPLAPGQRLHLRRAPGLPHHLDRADRRDARQRLPAGRPGTAPIGHAPPHLRRPARLRVPLGVRGAGHRRGAGGRGGRLLLAHATSDRAEHHRGGPQGLHPPVRADRGVRAAGRPAQEPVERVPCDEPGRQYEVLRDGRPVAP